VPRVTFALTGASREMTVRGYGNEGGRKNSVGSSAMAGTRRRPLQIISSLRTRSVSMRDRALQHACPS
jgi:hypothetical protein